MPPCAFPAPTHWSVPVVSTSSCLTAGDVVASSVAIAAVPTRMPSTGIDREAVARRPPAGQVLGGPLGGADAAADAHGDVGALAKFAVGGQQQVVEVLPGVVATGAAALDVHDDRRLVGTSAAILMTDLICSTVPGLNTTWLMPIVVELVDQCRRPLRGRGCPR